MPTEYALFDILIRAASPGSYTVDVRGPFGNPTYQQLAKQLQELDTDEDGLVELGQILFDSLFQSGIKDVYKLSQGGLKAGQGLRLRQVGADDAGDARHTTHPRNASDNSDVHVPQAGIALNSQKRCRSSIRPAVLCATDGSAPW